MQFKKKELEEYFDEFMQCYPWSEDEDDWSELHYDAFNTEPYIIGRQKAIEWCGDKTWDIIKLVKDYEDDSFGKVSTDLTNPEKVVNMYVYIIGQDIVSKYFENIILKGIICNHCEHILPPHTREQHLNIDDPIHTCPHNQKD